MSNTEGKTIQINSSEFHKRFVLGYALTSYKSQGDTINEPYQIHEWNKLGYLYGGQFTTLTIAKSYDQVSIVT